MENKVFLEKIPALISEKKFSILRNLIIEMQAVDISEIFEELTSEESVIIYRLLPKQLAADVFVKMSSERQEALINLFSDYELGRIINSLYVDDTVDLIEEMPATVVKRILIHASPEIRLTVNELLKYPETSAGSIMTTDYVSLKQDMTVKESFEHLRKMALNKETVYTCYVTDLKRRLMGVVTVKTLLSSNNDAIIRDIMEQNAIYSFTLDDREQVVRLFDKYNFLALPVVDNEKRLVGIITVDDAINVLNEETEEDFAKMAAITPTEKPYLRMKVFDIWKSRVPWLLILMISATFTGIIISGFENALQGLVVLTVFIPMLMDTGGNSGSQASVTVIRGISLGEINFRDIFRVIWKEFRVSLLCGIMLSSAAFFKIILVDRMLMGNPDVTVTVASVVSITLFFTVFIAKIIGCSLPVLAKKIGLDPAVMASPFITTIVDAISLLVYFGIASSLLDF